MRNSSHRSRGRAARPAAILALLLACLPSGLVDAGPSAQEARDAIPSLLVEREEVRFVTLDLVPHVKRRGRWEPARDLRAGQLEVLVAGRPMELELFENWCRPGGTAEPPPETTAPDSSPAKPTPEEPVPAKREPLLPTRERVKPDADPPSEPGLRPPTQYVLYFDFTHLKQTGHGLSFEAAEKWVDEFARPDDGVMIVTGGRGLKIIRPMKPTTSGLRDDLQVARQEFAHTDRWADFEGEIIGRDASGKPYAVGGRSAEILGQMTPGAPPTAAEALANGYAAVDFSRTKRSLKNLEQLMTLFDSIEGTKNLVFFQETVRMWPGIQYPMSYDHSNVEPFIRNLATAANERNVRVYPVYAGGMKARVGTDRVDNALTLLASETGGRWTDGTNDLTVAFERVAEDDACFYRLGFRARARFSGGIERVTVKIGDNRGYRLRYRSTLADPTREERDADQVRAALLDPR